MLKLEKFPNIIQYAVYTHHYRLCIYYANFFWESTNENANLSLGTGMGFSYCVHLIIKPKTWQFWVTSELGLLAYSYTEIALKCMFNDA